MPPAPDPPDLTDDLPKMTPPALSALRATPRPRPRPVTPASVVGRPHNEGHGKRLTAAFEALELFPALAESRNRLLALIAEERPSVSEVVAAIESDVALVIAVLRLANSIEGPKRGQVDNVVTAVEVLSPEAVQQLAASAETFEFFERGKTWDAAPERFRLHAVSVQRAADRLAAQAGYPHRDRLLVTALLHDVGKLVLMHAYPGYPKQVHGPARTPEERLHYERRELGVDHALVGGVLTRRWNLPKSIASAIERHHSDDAAGDAAFVRLADMLAHYSQGLPVSSVELLRSARAVGFGPVRAALGPLRPALPDLGAPALGRAVPALEPRARGPQAAGQGLRLQADRPRALAEHQHGADAPPQHLRQARRGRPRPGRPPRHRAWLALATSSSRRKRSCSSAPSRTTTRGRSGARSSRRLPGCRWRSTSRAASSGCSMPRSTGSAADNDAWIERKNRVVRRFGHSSFYMGVSSEGRFNEQFLLDEREYAAHGGAFPVIVRGVGVVGTVTVSGLPQEEDHRLVVSVLRDFLA